MHLAGYVPPPSPTRLLLYFFSGRAFAALGCCGTSDKHSGSAGLEVTYEAALLARHHNDTAAAAVAAASSGSGSGRASRAQSVMFKEAASVQHALVGAPTYRLPHHPRYSDMFSNSLYKPIWFKAFGRLRYTTLVRYHALAC